MISSLSTIYLLLFQYILGYVTTTFEAEICQEIDPGNKFMHKMYGGIDNKG